MRGGAEEARKQKRVNQINKKKIIRRKTLKKKKKFSNILPVRTDELMTALNNYVRVSIADF